VPLPFGEALKLLNSSSKVRWKLERSTVGTGTLLMCPPGRADRGKGETEKLLR
jgi:hypothetical protein